MAEKTRKHFEVLVVGAGPAGLGAASAAASAGAKVGIVDENPDLGGQIWRGAASDWNAKLRSANVDILCGTQVVHHDLPSQKLFAEHHAKAF